MSVSDGIVKETSNSFKLTGRVRTSPFSLWFSYGSNLDRRYFNEKMSQRNSKLTLLEAQPATISGFQRKLDNRSMLHGLSYAIHRTNSTDRVEGIIHQVPSEDLGDFLKMEGILSSRYAVRDTPNYRIVEIDENSCVPRLPVLSLEGVNTCSNEQQLKSQACGSYDELVEYVKASLEGAQDHKINTAPFEKNLRWIKSLQC